MPRQTGNTGDSAQSRIRIYWSTLHEFIRHIERFLWRLWKGSKLPVISGSDTNQRQKRDSSYMVYSSLCRTTKAIFEKRIGSWNHFLANNIAWNVSWKLSCNVPSLPSFLYKAHHPSPRQCIFHLRYISIQLISFRFKYLHSRNGIKMSLEAAPTQHNGGDSQPL